MKRLSLWILLFSVMVLGTGCSLIASFADEEAKETKKEEKQQENKEEEAVAPNQTFKEIPFQRINWIMGTPDVEPQAGIWVYTRDKHPADLDDQDWDHEDMLYVQASSKYKDQDIEIRKLQVISKDVVKVVVALTKDIGRDAPPRDWATVEVGALDGKKFIVETLDGKKVDIQ